MKCRPRYKRHVDNIFPTDPKEGLVRTEMQKLTYYALTSPRKLDRIGKYLAEYLIYYVDHRRLQYAAIAMKAMEQLLQACRSSSINLFVESFLRMVQKLLECSEPDLQILGTTSFVQFANIQEDTPSYHRRYDFFVSKFSSMCWSSGNVNEQTNRGLRQAGLKGLQGVIHKTVSDDLQVNIWEQVHMQKIIPALLFNINEGFNDTNKSPVRVRSLSPWERENSEVNPDIDPDELAQHVLQDLVSRATFGHIKAIMLPLLHYMDKGQLWVPNKFPTHCMILIMHSIQMQSAYLAISQLLLHLEEHRDQSPKLRCSIVEVVSAAVTITAGESIGPTVLEVFNTLLRYLKMSIEVCHKPDTPSTEAEEETVFQEAVVQSVGKFSNTLQTYQKIDICTFILGKMPVTPLTADISPEDSQFGCMLLRCVMKISSRLNDAEDTVRTPILGLPSLFPMSLISPLQALSLSDNEDTRIIIQQIFHSILDRHHNEEYILPTITLGDLAEEDITIGEQKKQDVLFMKRNGQDIFHHLYESFFKENNTLTNYTCTYRSAVLWCLEVPIDEVLIELVHMVFGLQEEACSSGYTDHALVCTIHALVASFLIFVSRFTRNEALSQHVMAVVRKRTADAPHLLPKVALNSEEGPASYTHDEKVMFDASVIADCLSQQGMNTDRLSEPYTHKKPRVAVLGGSAPPRTPESVKSMRISLAIDTKLSDVQLSLQEEITFDTLKAALQARQITTDAKRNDHHLKQTFEERVALSSEKNNQIKTMKKEVFGSFRYNGDRSPTESTHSLIDLDNLNNLSVELPDMYIY